MIQCIVGLGNPGSNYATTRHNAGWWALTALAPNATFKTQKKIQCDVANTNIAGQACLLIRPHTFMNLSGQAVQAALHYYKIELSQTLVLHDELDLEPGDIRLKQGGGHGGHNGLRSLIQHCSSPQFYRLRIGIGHPGDRDLVSQYVLQSPRANERDAIDEAIARWVALRTFWLSGKMSQAMTQLHTRR